MRSDLEAAKETLIDKIMNKGLLNEAQEMLKHDLGEKGIIIHPNTDLIRIKTNGSCLSVHTGRAGKRLYVGIPLLAAEYADRLSLEDGYDRENQMGVYMDISDPDSPDYFPGLYDRGYIALEMMKKAINGACSDLRLVKDRTFRDEWANALVMPFRYRSSDYRIIKPGDPGFEEIL